MSNKNNLDLLTLLSEGGEMSLEAINTFLDDPAEVIENQPVATKTVDDDPDADPADNPNPDPTKAAPPVKVPDALDYLNGKVKLGTELDKHLDEEDPAGSEGKSDPEEDEDDQNYFEIFGKGLLQLGKLMTKEGEDPEKIEWNEASFIERFDQTVEDTAWNKLEDMAVEAMGEEGLQIVEDLFIKKAPVRQYLQSLGNSQSIAEFSVDDEIGQSNMIRFYLKNVLNEEDEIIADHIAQLKNSGALEKRAKHFQTKLLENESKTREQMAAKAAADAKARETAETQRIAAYKKTLEEASKTGSLNGLPVKKDEINKILHAAVNKEYITASGQKLTPFEYKVAKMRAEDPQKYLQLVKLVEDNLDLSTIKAKGVTEKTDSIFQELEAKSKRRVRTAKNPPSNIFGPYFNS